MFTGLVETLGRVVERENRPPGCLLRIAAEHLADDAKLGDSICVNGCCLTIIGQHGRELHFEAGEETLRRTNLGRLEAGDVVNLERALCVGDRLGGHYVTGHVDALGTLIRLDEDPPWAKLWFQVPQEIARHFASKGSVAVDGVSLTLVDVNSDSFSVALIPHTLSMTTLGRLRVGEQVNIETDVLAKYVERQLQAQFGWKTDKPLATSPDA